MTDISLKASHELDLGILVINASENKCNDLIEVNISFSFTRYSDGKLFELKLSNDQIQKLHGIFFDSSLILDLLELKPTSMQFINNDCDHNVIKNIPGGIQNISSEILDIVWEFTINHADREKSKQIPISVKIPEKQYSVGSNQQIIELSRLLNCCKQRIIELESSWTRREIMNIGSESNIMIPQDWMRESRVSQPKQKQLIWLSSSNYGTVTGLNQIYIQLKKVCNGNYNNFNYNYCNWLQQNKWDEVQTAEYNLNFFTEENELELLSLRFDDIHKKSSSKNLYGYFRPISRKKILFYTIAKHMDPPPIKYETAFYLRDAYQCKKECKLIDLTTIDNDVKKCIEYNSQWVIYKICV